MSFDETEIRTVTVDGMRVAFHYDDSGSTDPVDDYDHAGTLYAWRTSGGDIGPRDGQGYRYNRGRDWRDAAGFVRTDDGDGWARETAADVSAAGGYVVPVAYHNYGSSGSVFGPVDSIDDANGLFVLTAADVAGEWITPPTDAAWWARNGWADARAAAAGYADAFLAEVGAYVRGEVYGYTVTAPDGTVVDSCWGFIGADPYADPGTDNADGSTWMVDVAADVARSYAAGLAAEVESPNLAVALAAARTLHGAGVAA